MAKLCLKKPSKRQSCRKRYKIEKKIREHNRKKRREAKKSARKPSKKLIHIPNICPFKESILNDAKEYKDYKEKEKQIIREQLMEERANQAPKDLQELVGLAQSKHTELGNGGEDNGLNQKECSDKHKSFYREFQKVVAAADVILEVVDSRDPLGTRCPTVEKSVKEAGNGKRLVLVLNKADLVPRDVLQQWLKYLRRFVPCIPFKSSTQKQNHKLGRMKMMKKQEIQKGGISIGAEGLTSLLGNYTRNKGIKTSIRVGVVGLPNVGKSSLINTLKRNKSCKVGAVPGVTRTLQEIHLDSKIKLLDCPGLAFAGKSDPHAALKNAVLSSDYMDPAEMVIARAQKAQLMKLYLVPSFNSTTEFLTSLAKRYGRFKKGGVPDLQASAKIIVDDWNSGKIEYHTKPPEDVNNYEISSSIVTEEVAEFNLDDYDKTVFKEEDDKMEIADENEEAVKGDNLVVSVNLKKKNRRGKGKKSEPREKTDSLFKLEGNQRLNKIKKLEMKKLKKQKARNERKVKDLTHKIQTTSL
ncbi:hypothetical protein RUM44_004237 [Polyplax serrata]|uniref:CP-type G domain-containing protein n=1 Tax=Polyplax serrata TaxID=468196 RepID=A0ABR1B2A1_POLSC